MLNVIAVWPQFSPSFRRLFLGSEGGLTCGAVRDGSQVDHNYGHHSAWVSPTRLSARPISHVYAETYGFNVLKIREIFLTALLSVSQHIYPGCERRTKDLNSRVLLSPP